MYSNEMYAGFRKDVICYISRSYKSIPNSCSQRATPRIASDIGGRTIPTEGLFAVPWGFSFRNHRTLDENDHPFEIMKTSADHEASIPAWYLNQHQAQGITTGHLYFPNCSSNCFGHGLLHPEYEITYDEKVASKPNTNNVGAIILHNSSVLQKLPKHNHNWSLLFDLKGSEKSPTNSECDHRIEHKVPEANLRMGAIYQ